MASGTRLLQKCDREVDRIERSAFHDFSPTELKVFRGMISKALSGFEQDVDGTSMPASLKLRANGGRRASA
jgi:hypothetical protein